MAVLPFQPAQIFQSRTQPASRLRSDHGLRLAHYRELQEFYEGRHYTGRRPGHSQIVANYARAIVDKHVSYTFARGIQFQGPADDPRPIEQTLEEISTTANLNRTLMRAATNASVLGDAVLKVIYHGARIRILNVDPSRFFPVFASDDPEQLLSVTVLSPISPDEASTNYQLGLSRAGELLETWTPESLTVQVNSSVTFQGLNPYGFIPFIHVPNLAPPGSPWGLSDLEDVIPLNRELDDRLSDQADVIRYHADPPVVFKNVRQHTDLAVGPGTVWDIPENADVSLLEWRGQPPAVQQHIERVLRTMYDVAETPRSSFGDTEQPFSGVALETQLQPIVQRTLRRRIVWEPALRQLAQYCLMLAEQFNVGLAQPGQYAPYQVRVHWLPMLPRDDDAEANRFIALTSAGLSSHTRSMDQLGVQDPAAELQQVREDRQALGITTEATPAERGVRFVPPA